jgi:NADPH-dependent glutamate synthase beta subunit-like oxidoreductase
MSAFAFGFVAAALIIRFGFGQTPIEAIGTGLLAGSMSMVSVYLGRRSRKKREAEAEAEG